VPRAALAARTCLAAEVNASSEAALACTPRGAFRGVVVVGALVRGSDDDVAALGRASGRTRRVHAPSCGGRCLIIAGGSACVPTPCGALRGLVVVGALVEDPVVDVAAPGRASGHYGHACVPSGGGGACRVRTPCGARLGLVVEGALVVGPFVDLVGPGRASGRYSPRARASRWRPLPCCRRRRRLPRTRALRRSPRPCLRWSPRRRLRPRRRRSLSAPRGARHSIVVDGALVVGPFVDLVRMSSWAPCHILSGPLVFAR
jgi:hypothetical protein